MAFEQPLAADKQKKHPLLSAIVWLLGGNTPPPPPPPESSKAMKGAGGKGGGDATAATDGTGKAILTDLHNGRFDNGRFDNGGNSSSSSLSSNGTDGNDGGPSPTGGRGEGKHSGKNKNDYVGTLSDDRGRRMSWSDESGQDLVHYFKENAQGSAMPVGMKSSGSSAKLDQATSNALKSSLRRTTSMSASNKMEDLSMALAGASPGDRGEMMDTVGSLGKHNGHYSPAARFFGQGQTAGGLPQPGGAQGGPIGKNGHVSPQWGWYVSTTPPVAQFSATDTAVVAGVKSGIGKAIGADTKGGEEGDNKKPGEADK